MGKEMPGNSQRGEGVFLNLSGSTSRGQDGGAKEGTRNLLGRVYGSARGGGVVNRKG